MIEGTLGSFRRSDDGGCAAGKLDGASCNNAALSGSVSSGEDKADGHAPPMRSEVVDEFLGGSDLPRLGCCSHQNQESGLEGEERRDTCTFNGLPDGCG